MKTIYAGQHNGPFIPVPHAGHPNTFSPVVCRLYATVLVMFLVILTGCSGPTPHRLPSQFDHEPQASQVIQEKLSAQSNNRLPVGTVIVLQQDASQTSPVLTENAWPQLAAKVGKAMQHRMPVSMHEAVRLEEIPSKDSSRLFTGVEGMEPVEMVLVVLPSSKETAGPAHFDLLPESGMLTGQQIENYATVELGLLDSQTGKLLLQSQGTSYATLEKLDVPLASHRYPRVRGSAMTIPIYPEEEKALETLRMVALHEAVDQAVMKLAEQWPHEGRQSILSAPALGGEAS